MNDSLLSKLQTILPPSLFVVDAPVDWQAIEAVFPEQKATLLATEQDREWHGEGNVWVHTRMTVESLTALDAWRRLPETDRIKLFLAAFLHDVGKPSVSRVEDGHIVSPKHAKVGSQIARELLWTRLGLNTDPALIRFREEIVALVRRHSYPLHLLESSDPLRDVVRFSFLGKNHELAILAEADFRGRLAGDRDDSLEKIELFREFVEENGVADAPFPFPNHRSAFGYFSERLNHPTEMLYDDSWGEVVLMSGLPASGKDFYIEKRCADWPMVSLDVWRKRLKIDWLEDQSPVILAARKEATDYLRRKVPFVWNATHLRKDFRSATINHCVNYGARVRIVWCEAALDELRRRNAKRAEPVRDSVFETLFSRMEPPTILEAETFEIHGDV